MTEWDALVKDPDKNIAKPSVTLLRQLHDRLDDFLMEKEKFVPIPTELEAEIVSGFGEEVGHILATSSLVVANRIACPSDIWKMYQNHEGVPLAFITLMGRGSIRMPMFGQEVQN